MGLLSIFKRSNDAEAPAAAAADVVAAARSRARQRLIGATVLLGIGVIGFPLLFETQPRPIAVDIPIEIARKDGAPPLVLPAPAPALSPASAAVLEAEAPAAEPVRAARRSATKALPPEIVERADDAAREPEAKTAAALAPPRATVGAPASAAASASAAAAAKPPAAASKPSAVRLAEDDGARAQALLNGQAGSAPAVRVVVQVGAYSDTDKLREARQKLEKLGLKTYTQVVEVDGSKRTRVRVGPFETRADADRAAARIKAAGLPVAILSL